MSCFQRVQLLYLYMCLPSPKLNFTQGICAWNLPQKSLSSGSSVFPPRRRRRRRPQWAAVSDSNRSESGKPLRLARRLTFGAAVRTVNRRKWDAQWDEAQWRKTNFRLCRVEQSVCHCLCVCVFVCASLPSARRVPDASSAWSAPCAAPKQGIILLCKTQRGTTTAGTITTTTTTASQQRQNRKPFSNIPGCRSHYPPLPPSICPSVWGAISLFRPHLHTMKKIKYAKKCETVPGRTHDTQCAPLKGYVFFFLNSKFRFPCYPDNPFIGHSPERVCHKFRRRTFNLHFVGISKIKFLTYPRRSGSGVRIFYFLFFVFWVVYSFLVSLLYLTSEYSCRARLGSGFYFFHCVTPCKG